jgi:glycine reductase
MTPVALTFGSNRIVSACGIAHPLGNPDLDPESEKKLRRSFLKRALQALQEELKEQKVFKASL